MYAGAGTGSETAERALGLAGELEADIVGYGEPVPYKGISRPEELLRLYWGTSSRRTPSVASVFVW